MEFEQKCEKFARSEFCTNHLVMSVKIVGDLWRMNLLGKLGGRF
jgi:hypothetical protein